MNDKLAKALLAAQGDMPAVDRDGTNPHFSSRFTTLDNLIAKTRPVLNKHGLVLIQAPSQDGDGNPTLTTTLIHESGESIESTMPLLLTKNDPQAMGSSLTYAKRYALAAFLAIADQEDDDGNAASEAASKGKQFGGTRLEPSPKQLKFFTDLAEEAGFVGDDLERLKAWAKQHLTGGKGGSLSKAIDGLKEKSTRTETADRLGKAAKAWADESSDELVGELEADFGAEEVA